MALFTDHLVNKLHMGLIAKDAITAIFTNAQKNAAGSLAS